MTQHIDDDLNKRVQAARDKYFPMKLPNGCVARLSNKEEAEPFIFGNFQAVFADATFDQRWTEIWGRGQERWRPVVERLGMLHTEYILIEDKEGKIFGWSFGETEDMWTFYMRNTGILPEYRNQGIYTEFCRLLLLYLGDIGYERVTSHHLGTNRAILIPKLKLGFNVSGMELHEQFGPFVKLTYFLNRERKDIYFERYANVIPGSGADGAQPAKDDPIHKPIT